MTKPARFLPGGIVVVEGGGGGDAEVRGEGFVEVGLLLARDGGAAQRSAR